MNYLFANKWKKIGWISLTIGLFLGLIYLIYVEEPSFLNTSVFSLLGNPGPGSDGSHLVVGTNNIFDEIISILIIIGALLVAFSKEKQEDEYIAKIRLESLVWATYVNYIILLLAVLFVYGFGFFWALVYNMFTFLLFFIIRFNWMLLKVKKS